MKGNKKSLVVSRTIRRAMDLNFSSLEKYINFALLDKDETRILLNSITTNVSEFFRDIEQLILLKENILPELNRSLNILSAGCSTGEEPYTLAMILTEAGKNFEIDAVDVNDEVLETAKKGSYRLSGMKKLPVLYQNRYINITNDSFEIKSFLKEKVKFMRKNILSSYVNGNHYDIIFCKNVLIYFRAETRKIAINEFKNVLNSRGYLVMGSSETLIGLQEEAFEYVEKNIYRKRD